MVRARDAALKVLTRVEQDSAWAAAVLNSELNHMTDPREAAFATELVFGVLRRQPFLDQLLESASTRGLKKLDPMTRRIMRLGVYQIAFLDRVPTRAAVSEAVTQTRRSGAPGLAGLVNALLRSLGKRDPKSLQPKQGDKHTPLDALAINLGLPTWFTKKLIDSHGLEETLAMARVFNKPSRRTLRVNLNRINREQVLDALQEKGKKGHLTPWAIDVATQKAAAPYIEQGQAVYQDEGAQLVALALDAQPKERILDACAGRGGKTSALAMIMGENADIVALDRSESKLDRLTFELDRQGFLATTVQADLDTNTWHPNNKFHKILLDAPCSGSGTLGRRPEIRQRLTRKKVKSLATVQKKLLNAAAPMLAKGGLMVYAVCSVLKEEGINQITPFLEQHQDFHLASVPPPLWPKDIPFSGGATFISPSQTQTDGYQIISIRKRQ